MFDWIYRARVVVLFGEILTLQLRSPKPKIHWPFLELELELVQTQMTQKPMLRAEVYARALRASQNRKEDSV